MSGRAEVVRHLDDQLEAVGPDSRSAKRCAQSGSSRWLTRSSAARTRSSWPASGAVERSATRSRKTPPDQLEKAPGERAGELDAQSDVARRSPAGGSRSRATPGGSAARPPRRHARSRAPTAPGPRSTRLAERVPQRRLHAGCRRTIRIPGSADAAGAVDTLRRSPWRAGSRGLGRHSIAPASRRGGIRASPSAGRASCGRCWRARRLGHVAAGAGDEAR